MAGDFGSSPIIVKSQLEKLERKVEILQPDELKQPDLRSEISAAKEIANGGWLGKSDWKRRLEEQMVRIQLHCAIPLNEHTRAEQARQQAAATEYKQLNPIVLVILLFGLTGIWVNRGRS